MNKLVKKLLFDLSKQQEETEEKLERSYVLKVGIIPVVLIAIFLVWLAFH